MTPLIVVRQGSFAIGGTITTNEQEVKKMQFGKLLLPNCISVFKGSTSCLFLKPSAEMGGILKA